MSMIQGVSQFVADGVAALKGVDKTAAVESSPQVANDEAYRVDISSVAPSAIIEEPEVPYFVNTMV